MDWKGKIENGRTSADRAKEVSLGFTFHFIALASFPSAAALKADICHGSVAGPFFYFPESQVDIIRR